MNQYNIITLNIHIAHSIKNCFALNSKKFTSNNLNKNQCYNEQINNLIYFDYNIYTKQQSIQLIVY